MSIAVLHVLATDLRRGAETFGFELDQALRGLGVRSDIRCVVPGDGERKLEVAALGTNRTSPAGLRNLRSMARRADVVVGHGSSALAACGVALLGTGVPFVYLSIGDPRYWAASTLRRMRAGWLIRRAAMVVAIAPSARDVLVEHYRLDPSRVRVIPNGRSADTYAPADAEWRVAARARFGVQDGSDAVAVVGALSPEKRVDVAIEAISRLDGVTLLVAGDGPERSALEALANRRAPGRVLFLGATDGSADVLAAADAVVLSSDSEGVPGVLIEAGLSGLPVVATDVGWVRDVVRNEVTGLLVPPGKSIPIADAVGRALADRDEMGRRAREHCRGKYDMTEVTRSWRDVLDEVAARAQA